MSNTMHGTLLVVLAVCVLGLVGGEGCFHDPSYWGDRLCGDRNTTHRDRDPCVLLRSPLVCGWFTGGDILRMPPDPANDWVILARLHIAARADLHHPVDRTANHSVLVHLNEAALRLLESQCVVPVPTRDASGFALVLATALNAYRTAHACDLTVTSDPADAWDIQALSTRQASECEPCTVDATITTAIIVTVLLLTMALLVFSAWYARCYDRTRTRRATKH